MSAQLAKVLGQLELYRGRTSPAGYVVDELPNLWLFQNSAGQPMDYSKIRKVFTKLLAKSGWRQPPGRGSAGRSKQNGNILDPRAYRRAAGYGKYWSHPPESNRRPTDYESVALPTELGWLT